MKYRNQSDETFLGLGLVVLGDRGAISSVGGY